MICNQLKVIKYKNFKVKIRKLTIKQAKLENAYGLYIPQKSAIYIQQNLSPKNYLDILFHEIFHMILDKSGEKPTGEEKTANLIGTEFSKIFFQNPKLINVIKNCTT